jgi:hypothetical protein
VSCVRVVAVYGITFILRMIIVVTAEGLFFMCEIERIGSNLHMVVCKLDNIHQDLQIIAAALERLRPQ